MGRMLGAYDNREELDRPDLNKCPECGCFFAQLNCPLCGKPCPEHMRAGNRKPVKHKKQWRRSGGRHVTFVEWYHSFWFIAIMMFVMPVVGIILLATSPHDKWKKILFCSLAGLYMIVSFLGIGNIVGGITGLWERPVDTSLSREEYVAACEEITAEQFYRSPERYEKQFVCMTLRVVERAMSVDSTRGRGDTYYICEASEGSSYRIILRDCLVDGAQNLICGDVITVWGEGGTECVAYDAAYAAHEAPCLNAAYVQIVK